MTRCRYNACMPASDQFILTKMIATIGPACADAGMLGRLIEEGVRAFRINFSHGSFDDFKRLLTAVRTAEQHKRTHVTVIGDISGPKVRVGQVIDEGIDVHTGDMVVFQTESVVAGQSAVRNITFSTTRPDVFEDIQPGERVLVNDGAVRMLVHEKTFTEDNAQLVCSVTVGGLITTAKGMNLPDSEVSAPALSDKDRADALFAAQQGVDLIALQIRLAAGETMPLAQEDVRVRGHAIEVRINAENSKTFVPSPGQITGFHLPGGPGIRIDAGVYENAIVQPYYDSLVAKLIAYGSDRNAAIRRLVRALDECVVEGIHTTLPLHRELLASEAFRDVVFHTRWLEGWLEERQ